jgi:hypothetical protein
MNPYPLSLLNHLTVPVAITHLLANLRTSKEREETHPGTRPSIASKITAPGRFVQYSFSAVGVRAPESQIEMQRSEMAERQATPDRDGPASRQARIESRAPLLALGVILLVFLVALGSSRSLAEVSGPGDLEDARLVAGDLIFLLVGVIVIPAVLYVIWASLRALRDEAAPSLEKRRERRAIKYVLIIALVGGVLAALALTAHDNTTPARPSSPTGRHATVVQPDPAPLRLAKSLFPWVLSGVVVCLVLLFVLALIQRRRRGAAAAEPPEEELESPRRELREQLDISIAEIEREVDPRRAVVRAYAAMESTLARHGLGRHPFEAPGEYLGRAFTALRLSRRPGERLTRLFEQARFSTRTIGPEMKSESIAALSELRGELKAKAR